MQHNFTFEAAQADVDIPDNEDATVSITAPAAGDYEFSLQVPPDGDEGDRHRHLNTSTVFVL